MAKLACCIMVLLGLSIWSTHGANNDDADALYEQAIKLALVRRDYTGARKLLFAPARRGHLDSIYMVGLIAYVLEEYQSALRFLELAEKKGHSLAGELIDEVLPKIC